MKTKQLDELNKQHAGYLSVVGMRPRPTMADFVVRGLVNHSKIRLKPAKAIIQLCREKIMEESYATERRLKLHDLFESCAEHLAAVKSWEVGEKLKQKKQAAYLKLALPLMDRARLDAEANALELAGELRAAALKVGILSTPVVEED